MVMRIKSHLIALCTKLRRVAPRSISGRSGVLPALSVSIGETFYPPLNQLRKVIKMATSKKKKTVSKKAAAKTKPKTAPAAKPEKDQDVWDVITGRVDTWADYRARCFALGGLDRHEESLLVEDAVSAIDSLISSVKGEQNTAHKRSWLNEIGLIRNSVKNAAPGDALIRLKIARVKWDRWLDGEK